MRRKVVSKRDEIETTFFNSSCFLSPSLSLSSPVGRARHMAEARAGGKRPCWEAEPAIRRRSVRGIVTTTL